MTGMASGLMRSLVNDRHGLWAETYLAGALPAMVESLGDYYAAASIAGAPVPPPGVISRAITIQVRADLGCPVKPQRHHLP
jgi:hypothetical protein